MRGSCSFIACVIAVARAAVAETNQPLLRGTFVSSHQTSDKDVWSLMEVTSAPTATPSRPTASPTAQPTPRPTGQPTESPSGMPTSQPTSMPSTQPTRIPSGMPSSIPTFEPTRPTGQPTMIPTLPTGQPSQQPSSPSVGPSFQPTDGPTGQPSEQPSAQPTAAPSIPTGLPSAEPTCMPSGDPSGQPTGWPTSHPTAVPTTATPTAAPTPEPSTATPTAVPSLSPTFSPSAFPTHEPTAVPTTTEPTRPPSLSPTAVPSMEPSVQPTLQPTLQPSRSPTEQSLANQFAEAALADRLVYLLIGVGVLLIVLCCLISYCCMSYGLPSLCLIYKTNVAKVYVDAQGNEIENFERRANQKKKKTKRDKKEPVHELDDLSDSSEERPPQQRRDGRGQPSSQDASNEGKPRLSSAERRYTVHPGSLSQLEAMSPLSGLKTPQPVALEHAIKRKTESDSKPLPFTTLADAHPSDPASFAEDSAASVQFNLQMWIQGLITANDLLRQQLGIPIHVKSTRKVHNLMSVTHPLSVSEINLLVVYAQEMTDENAGLQRLLSNAVSPLEEERGRKRKMRPKSSPPKHSVVNPQMPFIDNSIEEDCSVQNIDLPDEESASPVIIAAAEDTAVNLDVSVPSTKTKPGILGRIRQGNDDFTNDLPKEALGYAAEAPRPQSPNPLDIAHQTSHKKDEANFVRIAKNNGKGEAMEEIVKHEKVEKRKQFAQNLYKQKR